MGLIWRRYFVFPIQNKESSKEIVSLSEQGKKQEDNLSKLQQIFDTAEKHPERTEDILIKLEGGK